MSTHTPRRLALAIVLALSASAWAAPDAQFQAAFEQFQQASQGNDSATASAADAFDALLKTEPDNPVLMAYKGAATAMKARTSWLPWKKMGYAEDGTALQDKALALLTAAHSAPLQHGVPAVLEVRFVAASTFLAVPGFMNRNARGAKLLQEVLSSPLFDASPLGFRGGVWIKAASVAAKDQHPDEARKYLKQVIDSNAPQSAAAQAQLAKLAS